ncbi:MULTISPECIES: shikimate kinase [Kordiimonas]|jgi:shikimate kinase|uniref:Shikimate kinase n=1 Tax=Kordiimonas lacus TaxID=637679 RepID=A0A1G6ULR0_9PROT|nr:MULTISPECIES: shikimate kinase [Kordiimonas]SDD42282.1 shikimate kinase [Kordiimonas lacus]
MTNAKQKNQAKKQSVARQYGVDRTIVLVGLMGAGKTTVGRRLARKLNLPFVDSDHEIEKAAGMSVAEIFECFGEADFRSGERRVIERLLDGRPQVVATGGGAFINEATRGLIKDKGLSIWLDADIEVLVERTGRRDTRPLLKTGDPKEILTRLAAERAPFYAQADMKVASSSGPHEDVVAGILEALKARKAA